MLNDKQAQGQSQHINITEKHGIVDSAFCQYFTNEVVDSIKRYLSHGGIEMRNQTAKELHNAKMVKMIVYEGKTAKVYCHLLRNGKCTSPSNDSTDKECIFK